MFKRARQLSLVELEYLKAHKDDPINQLCISLSNTRNQIKKALSDVNPLGKSNKKKCLPGNQGIRSRIGKRPDCNNMFFRSSWEANFYRLMMSGKEDVIELIQYEPMDFTYYQFGIKRGTISYTPDFKITYPDGSYIWVEVKGGWLKSSDKTRIRRFQKYYPEEAKHLVAVTPGQTTKTAMFFKSVGVPIKFVYGDLSKKYKNEIPNWEK